MTKEEARTLLDAFYSEMKEAEQLAYISCKKSDEKQEYLLDKYAMLLMKGLT